MNRTIQAAEIMLSTGGWYTAGKLGAEMGISAPSASGLLFNIRQSKKYQIEVTELPNRKVRVKAISGRTMTNADAWRLALFGKAA
ncbi:hypothetical protein LJ739_06960 [Aestuariibacter halophilus]|uniref:Uncharacterized protein n=1 Tax=Fluctibacter halophilus TaxID=226011 RepID=A0ABS8G5U0_9ALTE|nr:hypothetical protein [Aestuariibacter halophilus]MCC2615977.1 hypothetical protein [Aestuariibacter halophilus]